MNGEKYIGLDVSSSASRAFNSSYVGSSAMTFSSRDKNNRISSEKCPTRKRSVLSECKPLVHLIRHIRFEPVPKTEQKPN